MQRYEKRRLRDVFHVRSRLLTVFVVSQEKSPIRGARAYFLPPKDDFVGVHYYVINGKVNAVEKVDQDPRFWEHFDRLRDKEGSYTC